MPSRSVFSNEQRLEQTLDSLSSIRLRAPGAKVLVLENSEVGEAAGLVESAADQVISYSADPAAVELRDSLYKGAAETYMLLKAQEYVMRLEYDLLFKLSGRYSLTDDYDLFRFPRDRFGFLRRDGVYSTRLYSVPRRLNSLYIHQLEHALRRTRQGAGVEKVILDGVPRKSVKLVRRLGIQGYVAPTGDMIDE